MTRQLLFPSRRSVLKGMVGGVAAPMVLSRNSWAAGKTINAGIYASVQGEIVKRDIIPPFEEKYGCKVNTTVGVTLTQIATMRAQKANPQYSVMMIDDAGVPIATKEGLITELPVDKIPNLARVLPGLTFGKHAVSYSVGPCGVVYNPQTTKPVESWAELWSPSLRGQIITVTATKTQSVFTAIVAASLATGKPFADAQYDLDPAWPKLAELKPNILTIYDSNAQILLVAQGQATYGAVESCKTVFAQLQTGVPIDICYPKEGAFALVNTAVMVKNGPEPDLSAAFVDWMIGDHAQNVLAKVGWNTPVIDGLSFDDELLKRLAYPGKRMKEMKILVPDWDNITRERSKIIERFNQTLAS